MEHWNLFIQINVVNKVHKEEPDYFVICERAVTCIFFPRPTDSNVIIPPRFVIVCYPSHNHGFFNNLCASSLHDDTYAGGVHHRNKPV